MNRNVISALILLAAAALAGARCLGQESTTARLRDTAVASIVYIKPAIDDLEIGAGFIVNNKGYIFTNYHVIKGADSIRGIYIEFYDGVSARPEKLVYLNKAYDIALLKIAPVPKRPALPLYIGGEGIPGEDVVAFGHPLGFKFNMSKGVISGINVAGAKQRFLFDAPTNPGNSGGPLLNTFGQVIGMVEGRYDSKSAGVDVQNLNTAIKVQYLKKVLDSLKISYGTDVLIEDVSLVERRKLLLAQDSLRSAQAAQELAMSESRRRADSIQAGLAAQSKTLDSSRAAQEAMLKMIEKEREERQKFQDSMRYINRPRYWTARLGASYGFDFGAVKNLESNIKNSGGGPFGAVEFLFGYRANIEKNDDKGTIAAVFFSAGGISRQAVETIFRNEGKYYSSRSALEGSYFFENEYGIIAGETFRLSAGIGYMFVDGKQYAYYPVTGGFIFPLGPINIDMLFATATGREIPFPTVKVKVGLAYRINF